VEIIEGDSDYESMISDSSLLEVNENAAESAACCLQVHSKYALCLTV